ncbi:MAG TPA: hypothetical protein VF950_16060 [Planctomycetota bacterium]
MSTDAYIHAPGAVPLSFAELDAAMRRKRWYLLPKALEAPDEPLRKGVIYSVYGAPRLATLDEARDILRSRRLERLDPLYAKKGLNGVYLSVEDPDPDGDIPLGRHAKAVQEAKLLYLVNGHGGALQWALWEAIGVLTGGILSDPQSGDYRRPSRS